MSHELARESRRRARRAALQMLYQWEVGGLALDEVGDVYRSMQQAPLSEAEEKLAVALVRGTAARLDEIDALVTDQARHWRLERMALVDRAILRLAVYELLAMPATPRAVVINEALEVAKAFSNEAAVKFVNGVLDGVARRLAEDGAGTLHEGPPQTS